MVYVLAYPQIYATPACCNILLHVLSYLDLPSCYASHLALPYLASSYLTLTCPSSCTTSRTAHLLIPAHPPTSSSPLHPTSTDGSPLSHMPHMRFMCLMLTFTTIHCPCTLQASPWWHTNDHSPPYLPVSIYLFLPHQNLQCTIYICIQYLVKRNLLTNRGNMYFYWNCILIFINLIVVYLLEGINVWSEHLPWVTGQQLLYQGPHL